MIHIIITQQPPVFKGFRDIFGRYNDMHDAMFTVYTKKVQIYFGDGECTLVGTSVISFVKNVQKRKALCTL